ncbi:hypothetical protein METBIDRAFT_72794 [Metschnikowia bicuspidata var. bicuspidata NRRL YB-4993]|uniref:Clu domain-containing protein n=1 Tax=Metschnikowia bicuspidata var. bicuspidata NRRL YB-4993 TaxID=869754 RepID=A0A1A0H7T8_9ASCO|nr:hypothetical protein METBIDRAFT_72794 [Metschnikowia bicuspidata var. bicuspidata NRRL YB-4993]OBA19957.1 hypothetical protein METBIDRAFT_72794 [Metschnikowia bicuspidata var. bicuspidata NRRL YB-4993]
MADSNPEEVQDVKLRIRLPASIGAQIDFVETTHTLQETISDVKEALAASPQLNSVTNYSLVLDNVRITEDFDDFDQLSEVLGGKTGEVNLNLVEKPYNLKDVYDHLIKFRENIGMNFYDHASRTFSVASGFSKFNSIGLKDIQVGSEQKANSSAGEDSDDTKTPENALSIDEEDLQSIKTIVDSVIEENLQSLSSHVAGDSVLSKWNIPIKSLTLSQWNPVPQQQKLKGDLLYLTLTTLESETFSITCHASGFFVSKLSNANFDPSLKVNEKGSFHKDYLLYNLIDKLSAKFTPTLSQNKEALGLASQFSETYLIPSQIPSKFSWAVNELQIKLQSIPDYSRSQVAIFSNGVDGAEFVKDWNDEFQGIKEFPRETFNERLLRDKLLNKYIQDFNQAAVSTAIEIVNGNLVPLNPNESRDKHIFLRNNIFYSFGVDATGAHEKSGGDEAARYCFGKDISSVKLLNRIDSTGVCNLLSCVVDYLGERVVCQAPVPGVFNDQVDEEGQSLDKVACGYSIDENKINVNPKFEEVLKPVAEAFHLKKHKVELATGASTGDQELVVSKDTKGLIGTDGRKYLIDLYRTTPIDIDFIDSHYDESSENSYPHKEASLRHEAVEEWYKRKAAVIFKLETERLEKEGKLEGDSKPQIAISYDQITFNPDAFTGVNESDEDKQTVRELSEFVKKHLIPEFLKDVSENAVPYDGVQLSDYLHRSGINMRYLGEVAQQALKKAEDFQTSLEETIKVNEAVLESAREEEAKTADESAETNAKEAENDSKDSSVSEDKKERDTTAAKMVPVAANMRALYNVCVQEMIARASKHFLRRVGSTIPALLMPYFVSHFHNCLLGGEITTSPAVNIDELFKSFFSQEELAFVSLDNAKISKSIAKEVFVRFRYSLDDEWLKCVKPLQLLREIALKFGIQWKAQQYAFTKEALDANKPVVSEKETLVTPKDVVSFVPLVKDSSYRCSFVDEVFETARMQIQEGEKQIGLDLLAELVAFYQQIYGNVHQETTGFYSTLAQIYSECGLHSEASIIARKSTILHERLTGLDSYETINSYVKASFFDSLNKDHVSAFMMNLKAYQDWSVVYGPEHPNTVNTFSSFATILQQMKLTSEAKKFFNMALDLSIKLNGELSDITAILRHRLAVMLVQTNEYKPALEHFEKAAYAFNRIVGPDDVLSKECSSFATNLAKYLVFSEQQLAEKKKILAQQVNKKSKGSVRATKPQPVKSKKEKKSDLSTPDPEIASKSVDEILQFIEGKLKGKKSKKKN